MKKKKRVKGSKGHLLGDSPEAKRVKVFLFCCSAALLLCLSACGGKKIIQSVMPVETETKTGEVIEKIEPAKTGERTDVPVDVKPSEVVAKIETKTGGKVWIVKKKRFLQPAKIQVYENKQAVKEQIKINKPEKSYKWLYIIIGIIVLLIAANFAMERFLGFNPIAWLGARIFRRKK